MEKREHTQPQESQKMSVLTQRGEVALVCTQRKTKLDTQQKNASRKYVTSEFAKTAIRRLFLSGLRGAGGCGYRLRPEQLLQLFRFLGRLHKRVLQQL